MVEISLSTFRNVGILFFDIFEIDLDQQPFLPRHRTTIFQTPVLIPYNKHKIGVC